MKSKINAIVKSIFILALAGLAVFQLSQLWFVNITDRNLILYIEARFAQNTPDDIYLFARPFRIVTGSGDGFFNKFHSEIHQHDAWEKGKDIIETALTNARFIGQNPIDTSMFNGKQAAIFEYAFPVCVSVYAIAFGIHGGTVLDAAGMDNFYQITLIPPQDESGNFSLFFFCDEYSWEFAISAPNDFQILPASRNGIYFTLSSNEQISFQPIAASEFIFNPVLTRNPYLTVLGAHDLRHINTMVHPFFNNPATINQGISGERIYTFSNQNTMVRYHPNDVIEYTSFRPIGIPTAPSFAGDFSAAIAFISNDPFIANEFYLAGYEPHDRGYIFRFNYVINNFQMFFPEPWPTSPTCTDPLLSPIEVFVDQGRVLRYRRLAHNFEVFGSSIILSPNAIPTDRDAPFIFGFPIRGWQVLHLEASGG